MNGPQPRSSLPTTSHHMDDGAELRVTLFHTFSGTSFAYLRLRPTTSHVEARVMVKDDEAVPEVGGTSGL